MATLFRRANIVGALADAVRRSFALSFFLHMCTVCSTLCTRANGRSGKLELQCEARDQLQPRCGWAAHTYATRGEIRGLVPDLPNASVYLLEERRCSNDPSPTVKDVCHVCLAHDAQNRPKATGSAFTQGDTLL
jgi:hypothetical protein